MPRDARTAEYLLWREALPDGEVTTVYAARHPAVSTGVRVVHLRGARRLDLWCADTGTPEAIVGGFFVRDPYLPLGDLWVGGRRLPHEPPGDLLQAGPLLVDDGAPAVRPGHDPEVSRPARASSTPTSPPGAIPARPSASRRMP